MRTFFTIIAGFAVTGLIIFGISWFTGSEPVRQYAHEFFINGNSNDEFNFTYDLGIYSTEISDTTEVYFDTVSFIVSDTSLEWVISAREEVCSDSDCAPNSPSIRLPEGINSIDNTKTPLTLTIDETDYQYQVVAIGFDLYVEAEGGERVSNEAQRYSDGIGRVVIDKTDTPEDCKELTRLQIERLITQNDVTLARTEYPGIDETELDDEVILILAGERSLGDLLAIDSGSQCKTYVDTANLVQVGPGAIN